MYVIYNIILEHYSEKKLGTCNFGIGINFDIGLMVHIGISSLVADTVKQVFL
jgi:hypothetical protein